MCLSLFGSKTDFVSANLNLWKLEQLRLLLGIAKMLLILKYQWLHSITNLLNHVSADSHILTIMGKVQMAITGFKGQGGFQLLWELKS